MAKTASNQWLNRLSRMVPVNIPGGPPLPRRELVKLLKRVRKALDHVIAVVEKDGKPARKRKAAPRPA